MADKFPPATHRKIYITLERDGWRVRWAKPRADGFSDFPDRFTKDVEGLYELLSVAIADIQRLVGESRGKESR